MRWILSIQLCAMLYALPEHFEDQWLCFALVGGCLFFLLPIYSALRS